MAKTAGYSGTPSRKKLGIKDGMRLAALNAPKGYVSWLTGLPPTARIVSEVAKGAGAVHLFATERLKLERALFAPQNHHRPGGVRVGLVAEEDLRAWSPTSPKT
jgi:hypothetical protein